MAADGHRLPPDQGVQRVVERRPVARLGEHRLTEVAQRVGDLGPIGVRALDGRDEDDLVPGRGERPQRVERDQPAAVDRRPGGLRTDPQNPQRTAVARRDRRRVRLRHRCFEAEFRLVELSLFDTARRPWAGRILP